MSVWTHISGCIRLDGLCFSMSEDDTMSNRLKGKDIVEKCFGKTFEFDDSEETWNECTVPSGSESSVQYGTTITGKRNEICWGLIYIWGDLRDYDDAQEIFRWIKQSCAKIDEQHMRIRECCVQVEIEYGGKYLITDNRDPNSKEEIVMVEIKEFENLTSTNEDTPRNIDLD